MIKWYQKINLSKKIILTFFSILLVIIFATIMIFKIVEIQKSDSIRINLAGRQRMLTQKLTKEVLLFSENQIQKEEIEITLKLFEVTLYSLTEGGNAPLDLNFHQSRSLPKMENNSTKRQLLLVIELWNKFKSNISIYLNNRDIQALDYIIRHNTDILNEMNKSVNMMQKTSELNNKIIRITLFTVIILIVVVLVILLVRKMMQLQKSSSHIKNLESLLPICSSCKNIRLEGRNPKKQNSWIQIENYIQNKTNFSFTHSLCPQCLNKLYPELKK